MKHLRLASRRNRRLQRGGSRTTINLVSLMDIFTILVFFLLVNSSDVEVLPGNTTVELPEARSQTLPEQTLVIVVDDEYLLVQGRQVVSVADIIAGTSRLIVPLKEELAFQSQKLQPGPKGLYQVTILADKAIPYHLLKKIMLTCSDASFGDISLAVEQRIEANG